MGGGETRRLPVTTALPFVVVSIGRVVSCAVAVLPLGAEPDRGRSLARAALAPEEQLARPESAVSARTGVKEPVCSSEATLVSALVATPGTDVREPVSSSEATPLKVTVLTPEAVSVPVNSSEATPASVIVLAPGTGVSIPVSSSDATPTRP